PPGCVYSPEKQVRWTARLLPTPSWSAAQSPNEPGRPGLGITATACRLTKSRGVSRKSARAAAAIAREEQTAACLVERTCAFWSPAGPRTHPMLTRAQRGVTGHGPRDRNQRAKLSTRLPTTRYQPSTRTKKISLNGSEISTGG